MKLMLATAMSAEIPAPVDGSGSEFLDHARQLVRSSQQMQLSSGNGMCAGFGRDEQLLSTKATTGLNG